MPPPVSPHGGHPGSTGRADPVIGVAVTVSLADLGGWPAILGQLMARDDLTSVQAAAALDDVLEGGATSAQLAAFVTALRIKGETVEEMAGLLRSMIAHAEPLPLPRQLVDRLVDTCGTGGDRSGTANVSTMASLVVAGAGVAVCKHGNRAASSASGSADVLEALGVAVDLGPAGVARCVQEAGIGFCFAPRFHPALRFAGPTRRELGVPTALNFLGPLANPARLRRQLVGVSDPAMAEKMAGVLQSQGAVRALVVYGHDGLDELTTADTSTVLDLQDGQVRTYVVDPHALGLAPAAPEALRGGDPPANAAVARRVLDGERGPHRDIVLLNAAAALVAAGRTEDLEQGLGVAEAAVEGGGAATALERLVKVSQASRS